MVLKGGEYRTFAYVPCKIYNWGKNNCFLFFIVYDFLKNVTASNPFRTKKKNIDK